jgi:hypothetical protein
MPMLFNFALECDIKKAQENHLVWKSNWTHQLLVYDDDINLFGDSTETLIDANEEI